MYCEIHTSFVLKNTDTRLLMSIFYYRTIDTCLTYETIENCYSHRTLYWIGLIKEIEYSFLDPIDFRRSNWTWLDGSQYDWMNWYHGPTFIDVHPIGERHGAVDGNGRWHDVTQNTPLQYICQGIYNY